MSQEALEPAPPTARETLAARRERHDYDRLLMLSDGVFAIAITLGALEVRPPEAAHAGAAGLLWLMTPGLLTYAISFAVIAAYWSAHRRMFAMLQRVDTVTIMLNLLLLGLVALQPAAVGLLIHNGPRAGALELYLGLIVAIGLAQALFWGYAAFIRRLVDPLLGLRYRLGQLVLGLVLPVLAATLSIYSSRSGSPLIAGLCLGLIAAMIVARRILNRNLER